MKQKNDLRRLTLAALMAAMTAAATLVIRIPTPSKGYVNLGDCIVNIAGWLLGPAYGAAAAGIGSALADVIGGYMVYAPVTLAVKGGMAAVSWLIFAGIQRKVGSAAARVIAAVCAEILMCGGYFLFEAALYGSAAALAGVAANAVQGAIGAAVSVSLYELVIKRVVKRYE